MTQSGSPTVRVFLLSTLVALSCWITIGCASHKPADEEPKPAMSAGEGAISGTLVNADGDPFDLSLAANGGAAQPLEIKLINPDRAVVATTSPKSTKKAKSAFLFNHVKPGTYELSVYRLVLGKRTIAGSEPVTVDPGQVTPAKLTVQVKNEGEEGATR
jgi:hypothetical protein